MSGPKSSTWKSLGKTGIYPFWEIKQCKGLKTLKMLMPRRCKGTHFWWGKKLDEHVWSCWGISLKIGHCLGWWHIMAPVWCLDHNWYFINSINSIFFPVSSRSSHDFHGISLVGASYLWCNLSNFGKKNMERVRIHLEKSQDTWPIDVLLRNRGEIMTTPNRSLPVMKRFEKKLIDTPNRSVHRHPQDLATNQLPIQGGPRANRYKWNYGFTPINGQTLMDSWVEDPT